MTENRARTWIVDRSLEGVLSIAIPVLLCAGLLLPQCGCQPSVADSTPRQTAAQAGSEKTPVVSPEQPAAVNVEPEKAAEVEATPVVNENSSPTATTETQDRQARAKAPKIEFSATVQDLGEVGTETTQTTRFTFKNVGNAPLKIIDMKPCCGSTTRGVNAGDQFAPGKGGTLEVEYHVGSFPGPLRRSVVMTTNDPDQSQVNLVFTANVALRIQCRPERLSLFLNLGNAGCGPITVKSLDGRPFSIADFRATAGTITAEFDPKVKATEFVLKPTVDAQKLDRNPKGQISINLTHPECSNVRILYDVLPEFTVTPPQIMLFNIKPNEPVRREIWVASNYQEDFEIESVSSQQGIVKLVDSKKVPSTADVKDGPIGLNELNATRYQLHIEITPPPVEDRRSILSDILEVKVKDGETLAVQCRGFYAPN